MTLIVMAPALLLKKPVRPGGPSTDSTAIAVDSAPARRRGGGRSADPAGSGRGSAEHRGARRHGAGAHPPLHLRYLDPRRAPGARRARAVQEPGGGRQGPAGPVDAARLRTARPPAGRGVGHASARRLGVHLVGHRSLHRRATHRGVHLHPGRRDGHPGLHLPARRLRDRRRGLGERGGTERRTPARGDGPGAGEHRGQPAGERARDGLRHQGPEHEVQGVPVARYRRGS